MPKQGEEGIHVDAATCIEMSEPKWGKTEFKRGSDPTPGVAPRRGEGGFHTGAGRWGGQLSMRRQLPSEVMGAATQGERRWWKPEVSYVQRDRWVIENHGSPVFQFQRREVYMWKGRE